MSKIGRKPINLGTVQVEIKGNDIHFKGNKSSGIHVLPKELKAHLEDKKIRLAAEKDISNAVNINQLWGLHRALLANKIIGAGIGFEKQVRIVGLGYKAVATGSKLQFSLGYSHKIDVQLPEVVTVEIDKTGQLLTFRSAHKEILGKICSDVRDLRLPEPYKGTGCQYASEKIRRKAGKAKA
jgi:large subunit ribosomal protein L6